MVWNTIAHPKMMHNDGLGDASTMKNRPLLSVDTTKQSFYDFILNAQVVGYEESKIEGQWGDPIVKPLLVHGNYQDIYNKLMNAQLVIGLLVSLLTTNVAAVGQVRDVDQPLTNMTVVYIANQTNPETGLPMTVGGMPLIVMEVGDAAATQVYLDCLNRVWSEDDAGNIPLDT